MVDIVQKLRGYRPRYGWPEEYSTIVEPTMNHVAADEIERLRAENERLRKALATYACRCGDCECYKDEFVASCGRSAQVALREEKK
jgi:hypothetical protein